MPIKQLRMPAKAEAEVEAEVEAEAIKRIISGLNDHNIKFQAQ